MNSTIEFEQKQWKRLRNDDGSYSAVNLVTGDCESVDWLQREEARCFREKQLRRIFVQTELRPRVNADDETPVKGGPDGASRRPTSRGTTPAAGTGLSTGHISPRCLLTTHQGGRLLRLSRTGGEGHEGGRRSQIGGFSRKSRQRMVHFLASIDEQATGEHRYFITLTYPGQFPACARTWKANLDLFAKRLQRLDGYQAHVWKLEPQQRGAPHYHLLLFMSAEVDRRWVAQAWFEAVGSGRVEHLMAGTQCDGLKCWNGVMYYTSKYLAKVATVPPLLSGLWSRPGRWWGKGGTFAINASTEALTPHQFYALRRVMVRWVSRQMGCKRHAWGRNGATALMESSTQERLKRWAVDFSLASTV